MISHSMPEECIDDGVFLGKGAFGSVYKVTCNGKTYAKKVVGVYGNKTEKELSDDINRERDGSDKLYKAFAGNNLSHLCIALAPEERSKLDRDELIDGICVHSTHTRYVNGFNPSPPDIYYYIKGGEPSKEELDAYYNDFDRCRSWWKKGKRIGKFITFCKEVNTILKPGLVSYSDFKLENVMYDSDSGDFVLIDLGSAGGQGAVFDARFQLDHSFIDNIYNEKLRRRAIMRHSIAATLYFAGSALELPELSKAAYDFLEDRERPLLDNLQTILTNDNEYYRNFYTDYNPGSTSWVSAIANTFNKVHIFRNNSSDSIPERSPLDRLKSIQRSRWEKINKEITKNKGGNNGGIRAYILTGLAVIVSLSFIS